MDDSSIQFPDGETIAKVRGKLTDENVVIGPPNKFPVSRPPPASTCCQLLNIPLFRILPSFSGYSCILTRLSQTVLYHVSAVLLNRY